MEKTFFFRDVWAGHVETVSRGLEEGMDVNMTYSGWSLGIKDGDTVLHVASRRGHVKVVELLIKNQADLNVTNKTGDTALNVACSEHHVEVVKLLIQNHADINVTSWNTDRLLKVACKGGYAEAVEALIQHHADINVTYENGDTALLLACREGHDKVVELLIKNQVNLTVTSKDGETPLHVASRGGHVKVVELLIKNRADLNVTNENGDTAVLLSCRGGHDKVVELLIKNRADLDVTNENGDTAVHQACRGGHDKVVELLITNQADLKVTDSYGDTALHEACRGGHNKIVELLIKSHADLNVTNKNGDTGLHLACRGGHDKIVELLIENQADLNVTNMSGDRVLHLAYRNGHNKIVELLIKNHADLNVTDRDGDTVLLLACRNGHVKIVELLIKNQADLNVTDRSGDTAFILACTGGLGEVVEMLIKNQADLNVTDWDRDTALLTACREGHDKVVELLITNRADLNVTNKDGDTALLTACRRGHDKVVELLITNQADLNVTNSNGDTALLLACRGGHDKVVELLIKNQADLNVTDSCGDTGLHEACRGGHDKVVELLVRRRADLLVTNKRGRRPVNLASGLGRGTRLLVETETRKQADYSELVSSLGSEEETAVKLFLCGDGQVGKTSLRTILENTGIITAVLWNIRSKFRKEDVFNPTPGVHVSKKDLRGVGRLSLHDFAGQAQFYVTHAMLLRTTNAIFPVVYKITDEEEKQKRQVHGWLSFIHCSNADPTNKPRIVLIASHADKLQDQKAGRRRATAIVNRYAKLFRDSLVVSQEVFLMNCMEAGSHEVARLRKVIAAFRDEMLRERPRVPKLCAELMAKLSSWRQNRRAFPVMEWGDYLESVMEATSSIRERIVQLASSYLHDVGEIIYLGKGAASLVVLDPQWLCSFVFGRLLAPENFPIDKVERTAEDYVTIEELTRVFGAVTDIPLLIKLLEDFQLCHTYDNHTFILPSLLQQEIDDKAWSAVSSKAVYFGIQICCRTEIDSFSCDLFPRLQTLLMQAKSDHPNKLTRPLLWKNSAKCTDGNAEALLQITQDKRQLNILVRSIDGEREDCKFMMDFLMDMAFKLLHETSPGAKSRDMILSALDLREHTPQPHAYSREEVREAAAKGMKVVHPQRNVPEKVKDLLLHFGDLKGMLGRVAWKRPQLVETLRHINPILDHLRQDDVINMEEDDRIKTIKNTKGPQDAARELLNILEAKGEQACIGFHSALKKADPIAANFLDESPMSEKGATAS